MTAFLSTLVVFCLWGMTGAMRDRQPGAALLLAGLAAFNLHALVAS